jgi:hypothetical protein
MLMTVPALGCIDLLAAPMVVISSSHSSSEKMILPRSRCTSEVECRRASSAQRCQERRRRRAPPAANVSRAKLPPRVDQLSCVDHLCVTTVAVGGDAFARHLAEHTAGAPGDPVTAAHKITKVRSKIIGLEHRTKCLAVGGCRLGADPHPAGRNLVPPRPMTFSA